jgi:hypothetical protein
MASSKDNEQFTTSELLGAAVADALKVKLSIVFI